ncbi:hypothetical protein Pcinc_007203 [Petrolisthes cinctipes]|uniref:Uncharacterized protein n=1 Tax=Petrolisthes cinctipes TaxID=88211 RepID=A0AAE1KYD1_PETCI|nr:hypothetical protein Pcinc_007203 [Petrolisthes cinctipes]
MWVELASRPRLGGVGMVYRWCQHSMVGWRLYQPASTSHPSTTTTSMSHLSTTTASTSHLSTTTASTSSERANPALLSPHGGAANMTTPAAGASDHSQSPTVTVPLRWCAWSDRDG